MACASEHNSKGKQLNTESYIEQRKIHWPRSGRHILTHYDEDTIIVYQAFNPSIAEYAVENQQFGKPDFSYNRWSWIKTNFLWMMYRCGWASKNNQERVLAVTITRTGFDEILANAYSVECQKSLDLNTKDIEVRLQWDPDHNPTGGKQKRSAIQLGLKGNMLKKYGTQFTVKIDDITPFVEEQRQVLEKNGRTELQTPSERVYKVTVTAVSQRIDLDIVETDPTAMACASEHVSEGKQLKTESYVEQRKIHWPRSGRHILAHYDEDTIVVYQAFNPSIAEYAVENQQFGGPDFSYSRMSWIKTNFLWMMYRCGWASKNNQERVLAVTISRTGFDEILANAYSAHYQKSVGVDTNDIEVRLQWDPDHDPTGEKEQRRAIQLGLKGNMLKKYGTQFVVKIDDITPFVKEQRQVLKKKGQTEIQTPMERVYDVTDSTISQRIHLDIVETGPTVVS